MIREITGRRNASRGGGGLKNWGGGGEPNQISWQTALGTNFMAAQFGNGPQKCQLPIFFILF
jgi:hypothetical protein